MKNIILFVSFILATNLLSDVESAVVYGKTDPERLHKFYVNYAKCNEELGRSPAEPRVDTIYCTLKKDPILFNENGEFIKKEASKELFDYISDADKLKQAQAIFTKCQDEAIASGATGEKQTLKIISCCKEIVGLVDKEE